MTVSIQVLFCQCIFIVLHPFPVVWRRYKVQMETFGLLPTSTSCLSVFLRFVSRGILEHFGSGCVPLSI